MMDPYLPLTTTEHLEWGNPIKDKTIYSLIKNYSPVENLNSQTLESTDIWITAGLEDQRVPLWQSLGYTRKLRDLTNSNNSGKLVLFLSKDRAHTFEPHIDQEIHETSLELAFLIQSLNKSSFK